MNSIVAVGKRSSHQPQFNGAHNNNFYLHSSRPDSLIRLKFKQRKRSIHLSFAFAWWDVVPNRPVCVASALTLWDQDWWSNWPIFGIITTIIIIMCKFCFFLSPSDWEEDVQWEVNCWDGQESWLKIIGSAGDKMSEEDAIRGKANGQDKAQLVGDEFQIGSYWFYSATCFDKLIGIIEEDTLASSCLTLF